MKQQITTLFEYEKWANARILDALAQAPNLSPNPTSEESKGIGELKGMPDEKCLELMSHILLVQMVWYARMDGKAAPPVWAKKSLNECREVYAVNNKILTPFIEKQTNETLNREVEYKNTKGDKFTNTVEEILTHLFNHSTYHRGQIVERLKGKIPTMPVTDFIVFLRGK